MRRYVARVSKYLLRYCYCMENGIDKLVNIQVY